MSIKVMQWVWENSTLRGAQRMVLLAIADCASDDGGNAWPSIPTIAEKSGLAVRTVQRAIRALVQAEHLQVQNQAGPNGVNRYRVVMTTGVIPSPRQSDTGDIEGREGVTLTTGGVTSSARGVSQMSPVTVLEPSIEPSIEPSAAHAREIDTRTVMALAAFFTEAVPISNTSRTRSVIAKALGAGITATKVRTALETLIAEGRGCTEDTLRIALQPRAPSTTNTRVAAGLALAEQFRPIDEARKAIEQ